MRAHAQRIVHLVGYPEVRLWPTLISLKLFVGWLSAYSSRRLVVPRFTCKKQTRPSIFIYMQVGALRRSLVCPSSRRFAPHRGDERHSQVLKMQRNGCVRTEARLATSRRNQSGGWVSGKRFSSKRGMTEHAYSGGTPVPRGSTHSCAAAHK